MKVTIGEYAKTTDRGEEFVTEQEVDLSDGEGVSAPFNARTTHIRVCGMVHHRWRLGRDVEAAADSQLRPAWAVEPHEVDPGQGWVMSFLVEGA